MILEVSKGPQMFNPTINTIVLIIFGYLIGAMLAFSAIFRQKERLQAIKLDRDRKRLKRIQTSMVIVTLSWYGLIAVFILVLKFSTLRINWLIFLGSFFVGFLVLFSIFELAKRRKIIIKKKTKIDILTED